MTCGSWPPTVDQIVCRRPRPRAHRRQHLCGDKGYAGQPAEQAVRARQYVPHIPQRGEPGARRRDPQRRARRWVVERTHSWLNRFRKLLVRFEKTTVYTKACWS